MKTLIIVDVQNDFIEGGSLAVTGGQEVAQKLTDLINQDIYDVIYTTQDWHINPGSHWADEPDYQDSWPVHCEAGTNGAEIHQNLKTALDLGVSPVFGIQKGQYKAAYSGFEGTYTGDPMLGLADMLRNQGVTEVDVVGLATDHCVRATVLDALKAGFAVNVLTDYIAGVGDDTSAAALTEMEQSGAVLV